MNLIELLHKRVTFFNLSLKYHKWIQLSPLCHTNAQLSRRTSRKKASLPLWGSFNSARVTQRRLTLFKPDDNSPPFNVSSSSLSYFSLLTQCAADRHTCCFVSPLRPIYRSMSRPFPLCRSPRARPHFLSMLPSRGPRKTVHPRFTYIWSSLYQAHSVKMFSNVLKE